MKDMTVEELIREICDDAIAVDSPELPDELLRRFEELEKENEKQKEVIAALIHLSWMA